MLHCSIRRAVAAKPATKCSAVVVQISRYKRDDSDIEVLFADCKKYLKIVIEISVKVSSTQLFPVFPEGRRKGSQNV
jgi:hypothetical protein